MKIYTKQGDKGTTAVYTHEVLRLSKDDILLDCYGTLDELNANLGLIVAKLRAANSQTNELTSEWLDTLQTCQQQLFAIGFAISDDDKLHLSSVDKLEVHIDKMQSKLPPQTSFILPGGSEIAAQIHVARTITRRAERILVSLSKQHEVNEIALTYLNRLSDFLFVLARYCNFVSNIKDISV
ncbi:cob(I)yrinic acid a,c-diamide adenosyltransferase [Glaciecola petra]|uniref:Corrinoid adenosyltransferase n=1 Tax=Glaciecola petra TaxID=3075602 RepID=A0ABU2ZNF9_9ALTE|nr:cob(I)yrinic acid a,c-diamide adenosyltransferase [Aestuariibacter sp. P117]MDT0594166.1 cob(I)yrinic acid a,c-diamide adenosyltransferase [Aestuariibacter sp. P117]